MLKRNLALSLLAVGLLAVTPFPAQAGNGPFNRSTGFRATSGPRPLGRLIPLAGTVAPDVAHAIRLGRINPKQEMSVSISFKTRDNAGLQQFLRSVYTPGSVNYRHFLSPTQFAARFAPSRADRQQVILWLQSRGLRVVNRFRNGLLLTAVGSASTVQSAFQTKLFRYGQSGRTFFANSQAVRIPQGFRSEIAAVTGLDNATVDHPLNLRPKIGGRVPAQTGPNDGYSPSALAGIYDIKPLLDNGYTGGGQTIAEVQFTDFNDNNVATFDSQFNLPPPNLQRVLVSDGTHSGSAANDNQSEAELDIETVHAIAPVVNLLIYIGPKGSGLSVLSQIVSENRAQVITTSYGSSESHKSSGWKIATDQLLEEAAAQGQSFFAPAGDNGAYDAAEDPKDPNKLQLQVDFPSSDPWATSVGGTSLLHNSDGSLYEQPWVDKSASNPTGAGGGLSRFFKRPYWQVGPGVNNQYSNGYRQVPDVSAFADPDPGYSIYTVDDQGGGGWHQIGGTSAATPFWAAYASLLNQWNRGPIGFMNPTLYALGEKSATFKTAPYNDVTSGDNLYYPATQTWDFASGWGSMDGLAILSDIHDMGGPKLVRPADWSMQVEVAKRSGNKFVRLTKIKRGQKNVYLVVNFVMIAVPQSGKSVRKYSLTTNNYALYRGTGSSTLTKSDIGKPSVYSVKLSKIKSTAKRGIYTFDVKMSFAGYNNEAATNVTLS